MSQELLVALVAGPLGGLVVFVAKWLLDRRTAKANVEKVEAEAEKTEAETGLAVDQRWERWTEKLEARVAGAEREANDLKDQVAKLNGRVTELEKSLHAAESLNASLKRLLSSVTRWALTLKDELLKVGGTVPAMPADVEFALTTLEPE